jgi:hypothetical protein
MIEPGFEILDVEGSPARRGLHQIEVRRLNMHFSISSSAIQVG